MLVLNSSSFPEPEAQGRFARADFPGCLACPSTPCYLMEALFTSALPPVAGPDPQVFLEMLKWLCLFPSCLLSLSSTALAPRLPGARE